MLDMHMHHMHYRGMKLETYLDVNRLTDSAFGQIVNLSQSQVSRIKRGKSWPQREVMERIMAATGGKVTPNDFVGQPKRSTEPAGSTA